MPCFDREPKVPGRVARLGPDGPSARLSCGLRPRSLSLVGPAKPDPTRPRGAGGSRPPRAPPTTTQKACGHGTTEPRLESPAGTPSLAHRRSSVPPMKKLLVLAILITLGVVAA